MGQGPQDDVQVPQLPDPPADLRNRARHPELVSISAN
jgi:hypothetical protein